jgi:hypothetical protein
MNIVYIFFNRPDKVRRSFECIRAARPSRLFLVADGPRPDVPEDEVRCAAARELVRVDWPCDVSVDYSETNLGCRRRVSSGISNAFNHVDRAIILEDDCIPVSSFFRFCEELLARYADDKRIMAVSGDNFQNGAVRGDATYYFSKYFHCWGWATWRRAWQYYDGTLDRWPAFRDAGCLRAVCPDPAEMQFWTRTFNRCAAGEIDTWDAPYQLSSWMQNGLTILPNTNLVSNVGFGPEATHTVDRSPLDSIAAHDIGPIIHPEWVAPRYDADAFTAQAIYSVPISIDPLNELGVRPLGAAFIGALRRAMRRRITVGNQS